MDQIRSVSQYKKDIFLPIIDLSGTEYEKSFAKYKYTVMISQIVSYAFLFILMTSIIIFPILHSSLSTNFRTFDQYKFYIFLMIIATLSLLSAIVNIILFVLFRTVSIPTAKEIVENEMALKAKIKEDKKENITPTINQEKTDDKIHSNNTDDPEELLLYT